VKGLCIPKRVKKFVPLGAVNLIVFFRMPTAFLVFKSEMLHLRENLAEKFEKLCRKRYLPVKVPAIDIYSKGICLNLVGIDPHINLPDEKLEFCTLKPEVLCCVDKLQETWDRVRELIEEVNSELLEARGGDPTNKYFQVSTDTLKTETVEVRE